jgi:hypothetical protein
MYLLKEYHVLYKRDHVAYGFSVRFELVFEKKISST